MLHHPTLASITSALSSPVRVQCLCGTRCFLWDAEPPLLPACLKMGTAQPPPVTGSLLGILFKSIRHCNFNLTRCLAETVIVMAGLSSLTLNCLADNGSDSPLPTISGLIFNYYLFTLQVHNKLRESMPHWQMLYPLSLTNLWQSSALSRRFVWLTSWNAFQPELSYDPKYFSCYSLFRLISSHKHYTS